MTGHAVRAAALTLLCGLALLLGAGPAAAHTRLQSSDPADGASLATPPSRVSLTFNETTTADFSTLTVIGPDGAQWQTGDVSADGRTVGIAVLPLGPAGRYQIGYRVVSDDGHPVTGSVAFTLTTPGPGTASTSDQTAPAATAGGPPQPATPPTVAPAASASGDGAPVWPWVAGAVVLVGAGVVAALRLGRG